MAYRAFHLWSSILPVKKWVFSHAKKSYNPRPVSSQKTLVVCFYLQADEKEPMGLDLAISEPGFFLMVQQDRLFQILYIKT